MNNESQTLKQLLITDLNPGFVRALLERIPSIYPESYSAMKNDPNLGEEQGNYVLGHYRRGLAETKLMNIAAEYGLSPEVVQPDGGGCKHVYISTGQFGFAMCHVPAPDAFPNHSANREQSAQVNEFISQMSFPYDISISRKEAFYGILIHTEDKGKKDIFGSLKIGFPNAEFNGWVEEPICLQELSDIQQNLFQPAEDLQAQVQKADPSWKKITTDKEAGNKDI